MKAARTLALAAILSLGFAGSAFARDGVFTVTLNAPAAQARVIAENAIWNCEGQTCVARPSHSVTVRSCRQFVRQAGARVTAYGSESRQLSADEIARCNGDSPTLQAQN